MLGIVKWLKLYIRYIMYYHYYLLISFSHCWHKNDKSLIKFSDNILHHGRHHHEDQYIGINMVLAMRRQCLKLFLKKSHVMG